MEKENKHSLLQPLIPLIFNSSSSITSTSSATTTFTTPTTSSYSLHNSDQHHDYDPCNNTKQFISDNSIILRILAVLLIAAISIWANYEASKIFDITIVNDAKDSPAGRRFDLFYVSNDKATRIVLNTSSFVEHLLYPYNNRHHPKKHIDRVVLRLARRNLNATVTATKNRHTGGGESFNSYVIDISPMLLDDENFNKTAIVGAVQRAMARVWLWDGGSRAPPGLVDGMAEYVAELAGFRRERPSGGGELPECEGHGWWWEAEDPTYVARYLRYCEKYKKGFIQRLNEAMRDTWHDRIVDDVLGMPTKRLCGWHNASWLNLI